MLVTGELKFYHWGHHCQVRYSMSKTAACSYQDNNASKSNALLSYTQIVTSFT